jgi:hypothetical protein
MKAVNLALVALAGFGMAASQVAYADTLPGAALPSVQTYHPAKLTRLTSTRSVAGQATSADAGGLPAGAIILGGVALAGVVVAIVEVTKKNNNPVSTGS